MKWKIEIEGNHIILYQFINFMSSPHFWIYNDSDDHEADLYFLVSPHFNSINDEQEIYSMALGLTKLMNGALAIEYGFENYRKRGSLKIKAVYSSSLENPTDMQWTRNYFPRDVLPSNPFVLGLIRNKLSNPFNYATTAYIELSLTNNDIFNLLLQVSEKIDWIRLYCIWDTIRYYGNGENAIISDLKLDKTDIKAFTGTANSYAVLGLNSRHGIKGWEAPKNIITLDEATHIINKIVEKYLQKKYCLNCEKKKWNQLVKSA